ncbi:MAG: hypothetical protein HY899_05465 [Deltaproteobacteria bacterium]|nr:hypothetical protein [Deltaproteobacteria bacterium]
MSTLDDLNPSEMLRPSYRKEYDLRRSRLCDELILLNTNVHLLGQIIRFDRELFEAPQALFWYLTQLMLRESVIIATRVWGDRRRDASTLDKFGAWLIRDALLATHRQAMRKRLDSACPSQQLVFAMDDMRTMRNVQLAHLAKGNVLGLAAPAVTVSFKTIRAVADALGEYFNAASIGATQLTFRTSRRSFLGNFVEPRYA